MTHGAANTTRGVSNKLFGKSSKTRYTKAYKSRKMSRSASRKNTIREIEKQLKKNENSNSENGKAIDPIKNVMAMSISKKFRNIYNNAIVACTF